MCINNYIARDRQRKNINRLYVKTALNFVRQIDIDGLSLEKEGEELMWRGESKLIELTEFYTVFFKDQTRTMALDYISKLTLTANCHEFIKQALEYLDNEESLLKTYIDESFHKEIMEMETIIFVNDKIDAIIKMDTGLNFMLTENKLDQLKDFYRYAIRYGPCLEVMKEALVEFIKSEGNKVKEDKEISKDPKVYIPKLIEMKTKFDAIVRESFMSNRVLQDAETSAFMSFMSKGELTFKQLANYVNFQMRAGIKGCSDAEVQTIIDNIVRLFHCLSNKMMYIKEHAKHLSERLLKKKTLSVPHETKIVSELKSIVGASEVGKLTNMLNDLKSTDNVFEKYRKESKLVEL